MAKRKFTKYPKGYVRASISNEALWDLNAEGDANVTYDVYDNTQSPELISAIDNGEVAIFCDGNFWWIEDYGLSDSVYEILAREMRRLYPKCIAS